MKVLLPKCMYFWYYLHFLLFTMKDVLSQNCKKIFFQPEICIFGRHCSQRTVVRVHVNAFH